METVVANIGQVRTETLHGREYLVAPMSLIVPGVLSGSRGALLYPPDEVVKNYSDWNGIPIVVNHPTMQGRAVSARHPQVLAETQVGTVYNASGDGKLAAEGWFDVKLTSNYDKKLPLNAQILPKLKSGMPIELSTGLFTENEEAPIGAVWNGTPYDQIARGYRPDHLAILPDKKGACSLQDGCGVHNNRTCSKCGRAPETNSLGKGNHGIGKRSKYANEMSEAADAASEAAADSESHTIAASAHKMAATAHRSAAKEAARASAPNAQSDFVQSGSHGVKAANHDAKAEEHTKLASGVNNSNPEGHNQYTGGGSGPKEHSHLTSLKLEARELSNKIDKAVAAGARVAHNDPDEVKLRAIQRKIKTLKTDEANARPRGGPSEPSRSGGRHPSDVTNSDFEEVTSNSSTSGDDAMTRDAAITFLTTNCDCWKDDEKTLNSFDNDKLAKLVHANKQAQLVANSVRDVLGDPDLEVNAMPAALQAAIDKKAVGKKKPVAGEDIEDEDEVEEPSEVEKPVGNNRRRKPTKPITERLTADELAVWNHAAKVEKDARINLVRQLVANVKDPARKRTLVANFLDIKKYDLPALEDLVSLMPVQNRRQPDFNGVSNEDIDTVLDFGGAEGGGSQFEVVGNEGNYDGLDVMTMNDLPAFKQDR